MKHIPKAILTCFLFSLIFFVSNSSPHAQSVVLHNVHPAVINESDSDPYRSKTFRVQGIPDLQVNTPSGEIEVIYNPEVRGVRVDLYVQRSFSLWSGNRSLDTYRIIMQQRGDQIIASVEDRSPGRSPRGSNIKFNFVIHVPEEVSTNLRTLNGRISINGVKGKHFMQNQTGDLSVKNSEGEIRVVTTTGNIDLSNLSGNVFAKSVSGQIDIKKHEGEVRLRSVTGDINADELSGTLVSATTSGNMEAVFREVAVGVYMETISGNIDLAIPQTTGYNIQGKAMRFNFDGINPSFITRRSVSSREANVILGDGNLPVQLSTVSGRVLVRELY